MSLSAIRDQLKSIIAAADPESLVHDYERWTNEPTSYLQLLQPGYDPNKPQPPAPLPLHAWIITVESVRDSPLTFKNVIRIYVFKVHFVYSLADAEASEKLGLALIEPVLAAVRQADTLDGAAFTIWPTAQSGAGAAGAATAGLSLERWEKLQFGPVLCHHGELRLAAQEIIEVS